MPQSVLSAARVAARAGRPIGPTEWAELLFPSKAEFKELRGTDELVVEATADRLDLLCDAGLGLHLAGALGTAKGPLRLPPGPGSRLGPVQVDPSVRPLRPAFAAVELTPPAGQRLDAGLLSEAIRFQELLHATVGLDRRLASFGLYAAERVRGPLRYRAAAPASLHFTPLGESAATDGASFLAQHPMAASYGAYGRTGTDLLVLEDADGQVLSLPPILNAEGPGSLRPGDGAVLLESTGTRAARVADGLGLLLLPFVAAGWAATAVAVDPADGPPRPLTPGAARSVPLSAASLRRAWGAELPYDEVTRSLRQVRLGPEERPGGWEVPVPPWRPDLLAEVDLVEEVLLVRGVRAEDGVVPASPLRGRRRAESRFRDRAGELLLGAGFQLLHQPVLIGEARATRLGRAAAFRLEYPVSEELAVLRDRLLPSLVGFLGRNLRHGYPQRIAEVGPVVVPDGAAESGGRTRWHAAFALAADRAGFADAAARVDAVLRGFDALGVREPVELPGLTPGRAAALRIAGETVAELGELHPAVLEAEGIPVPVAYGEIDLTALWPLVRASETV